MKGLQSLLPTLYGRIGCKPEFKEDELAIYSQDASNASNGVHYARNRTQCKGANNCVNSVICQGNMFARKIEKFDVQIRPISLPFCKPNHPWVGFKRIELAHACGIVVNEVYARTDTDLQNFPLSQGG